MPAQLPRGILVRGCDTAWVSDAAAAAVRMSSRDIILIRRRSEQWYMYPKRPSISAVDAWSWKRVVRRTRNDERGSLGVLVGCLSRKTFPSVFFMGTGLMSVASRSQVWTRQSCEKRVFVKG